MQDFGQSSTSVGDCPICAIPGGACNVVAHHSQVHEVLGGPPMATISMQDSGFQRAMVGSVEVQEDVHVPIPGTIGGSQIVARAGDRITPERADELGISSSGAKTGKASGRNTAAQEEGQTPAKAVSEPAAAPERSGRRSTPAKPKEPRNATVAGRQTRGGKATGRKPKK